MAGVVLAVAIGLTPARAVFVSSLDAAKRVALGAVGLDAGRSPPSDETQAASEPSGDPLAPGGLPIGGWAALEGRVVDAETGGAVPGAYVQLDPYIQTTTTGSDGRFVFERLPLPPDHCPAAYLTVMSEGFEIERADLYLVAGLNTMPEPGLGLRPLGSGRSHRESFEAGEPPECARRRQ